jgi:hypothetical protein
MLGAGARVGGAVACCAHIASAQAPPAIDPALAYPIEITDRPLLLPSGVISLDISLDRSSYIQNSVDANGNMTRFVTSSGHEHDADITAGYGFGPVEVDARIVFQLAQLGASIDLGSGLGIVTAAFQYYEQLSYRPYDYAQYLAYDFKIDAIPKLLRFTGGASAHLAELSLTPMGAAAASGTTIAVTAGGGATVQIQRRVALSVGASVGKVVSYSPGLLSDTGPDLEGYATLNVSFHRWDLYAQGGYDYVSGMALPFAAIGFVHRWF